MTDIALECLEFLGMNQLREACDKRNLSPHGRRKQLISRLRKALNEELNTEEVELNVLIPFFFFAVHFSWFHF